MLVKKNVASYANAWASLANIDWTLWWSQFNCYRLIQLIVDLVALTTLYMDTKQEKNDMEPLLQERHLKFSYQILSVYRWFSGNKVSAAFVKNS